MFGKEAMLPYFREAGIPWSFEKRLALYRDLDIYEIWIDEIVGYLVFREGEGKFFLADIQIASGHRNDGIGTCLLEKTRYIAKLRGYSDIHLQVFKTSPAIHLYLRNGYERIDETQHMFVLRTMI
ncbi:MAG: GNAT family N-acetyltransferase [Halioglobus sp.]|nr:GNAT family N-acetyltransferase [Halioglobus sp.]